MQAFEEKVINKSVSEMATVPEVEPVVPSKAMNKLRQELSDLP
jgi:hypothetical protein